MFENRVLRKVCGPKRDDVTLEWGKLHNQQLYDLYWSPNYSGDQIKENEMGGACGTYGREVHLEF